MSDAPFTRSNLREQIKDVILQRILDGDYEPGARLVGRAERPEPRRAVS